MAFFFDTSATPDIYTLSLHDALPISDRVGAARPARHGRRRCAASAARRRSPRGRGWQRSEEHTSELQSRRDLVCRLLLEKKNKNPCQMATYFPTFSSQDC